MNAIRISKHLESETLHLPELKPFIGKTVEIIVQEEAPARSRESAYDAFFDLSGKDVVEPEAYKRLRSVRSI